MSAMDGYSTLVAELHGLKTRWRQQQFATGALRTTVLLGCTLLVAVALDNLLAPGAGGRLFLAVALLVALAWGASRWILRHALEDRREDFFAALAEQKHPELGNRLINGLQLGRGNDYGSPRLIGAIVQDAVRATSEMDLGDCLDWRPARRVALALGGVLLVVIAYATVTPRFVNGLARVLLPWADIQPYSATQVARVEPGDKKVFEGASVAVRATLAGDVIPDSARLMLRTASKPWQSVSMQTSRKSATPAGLFARSLGEVRESFDYYVLAGDGQSRVYHVEVVESPKVDHLTIESTPPAYTGRPAVRQRRSDGEISGLCGTQIDFQLVASKALREATLVTDQGESIPLVRARNDRAWQARFTLWAAEAHREPAERPLPAPTRYQIHLAASDGSEGVDPLWRSITLASDLTPSVSIGTPGRDLQVRPEESVELALVAKDDYGVGEVRLWYRASSAEPPRELTRFAADETPSTEVERKHTWNLASLGFKPGDVIQYWASVVDLNDVTGPGTGESQHYSLFVVAPEQALANLELQMDDYAQILEELVRLQGENRAQTAAGVSVETLVVRQTLIRTKTHAMADVMRRDPLAPETMVASLEELHAGRMADAIRRLESARDTSDAARADGLRDESLPIQDQIVEELKALLARLQRNEQARQALRKMAKTDKPAHATVVGTLNDLIKDLDRLLADERELKGKFEKLPKKNVDEEDEASQQAEQDLEEFEQRWNKWAAGKVDELTKLPTGFVDDFGLREDVNRVFEEIEKAAQRAKTEKIEVALEDLGASMATKMLEDLELWMPDSPDAVQWALEEPLSDGPLNVPEMPLPDSLEDLVGDLLQEAEEFDQEADDITSAWGDNLNQAGWDVADGPISSFSAKGKTGNDLPNDMEVSGRAGDGRRGKSSGQAVGDTARGLDGRKTPARLGAERYEPGQLKEEARQDPGGATGGGKKAGSGRRGLQGGTPPDFVKDMQRLGDKQAALREKAEQVAQKLDTAGVNSVRLNKTIQLMLDAETDLRDLRYEDAAGKRQVALSQLKSALDDSDQVTGAELGHAHELPAELREELLQAADEGYPEGYEVLLRSYFRALSASED